MEPWGITSTLWRASLLALGCEATLKRWRLLRSRTGASSLATEKFASASHYLGEMGKAIIGDLLLTMHLVVSPRSKSFAPGAVHRAPAWTSLMSNDQRKSNV